MVNDEVVNCDPATYWQKPTDIQMPQFYWEDPTGQPPGMLSSAEIRVYATDLHMIAPFAEDQLKPASYDLTVGPRYQVEGRYGLLTRADPYLEILPNSVAFVSMGERLMIPHFVIARFDLQIEYIYRGLLLGTGPQVDPGFRGVLSCPLHNISNSTIRLQLGKAVAKIDFARTAGLPNGARQWLRDQHVTSDDELYARASFLWREHGVKLFNGGKLWLEPIADYPAGKAEVTSSVAQFNESIEDIRRRVETFSRVGYLAAFIATVGLAAAFGTLVQMNSAVFSQDVSGRQLTNQAVATVSAAQATVESELRSLRIASSATPSPTP